MGSFLDTLRDRVVVFDGATGTNLQTLDLGADDFGGAALEGCNEILAVTRPDVIAELHRSFFEVGVDAVETDTFGAFPIVLAEYGIADRTFELNEAAARIAREVASGYATPDRPRWVVGSIGPGTKLPSLGQIDFVTLRDAYEAQVAGLLAGGVDVLLIETVYDLLQAKAAIIACRRAMAKANKDLPLMVQVTMETTGRMLVGTEIGAALTSLEALRPDVLGLNCATGPREMTEHLRHLSQYARTFLSCLPNAGLPSIVDGATHYDLTPDELAEAHDRFTAELGINIVGGCCGTTPEHLRRVIETVGGRAPAPRQPLVEPACSSIYTSVPFAQDVSFLSIGERTNANGSRKFRDAMLERRLGHLRPDGPGADQGRGARPRRLRRLRRATTAPLDMHEIAGRFATQAALPLVLDSTEPPVLEAGLQHIGGRALLNSANLEDGEAPGLALRPGLRPGPGIRRGGHLPHHRRGGSGPHGGMEVPGGQAHPRPGHRAVRHGARRPDLRHPDVPAGDRPGGPAPGRHRDDRRHPPHQGRVAGCLDRARRVERELRPEAGDPPRAQLRLPPRVRAGRSRRRHRPRGADPADAQDRRAGEDAGPRPDLRPGQRRVRPPHRTHGRLRGCGSRAHRAGGPLRLAGRGTPQGPHHRRGAGRPRSRTRRGPGRRPQSPVDHQRRAARRDEGRRRSLRLGPDAAAVRAPVGGDDEDGGGLPRAPHGEGRLRRQGPDRGRHREGRRPRHRQEPGRHHPHQQRLRGEEPRHQGDDRRVHRSRRGVQRRRRRHERPAGEEHADHAGQHRGAERPGPREDPRPPRRRRAHPQLCRARPAGALQGPPVLRQGRLRGPAHHGDADRGQEDRPAGPRLRPRSWAGGRCPRASRSARPTRSTRR